MSILMLILFRKNDFFCWTNLYYIFGGFLCLFFFILLIKKFNQVSQVLKHCFFHLSWYKCCSFFQNFGIKSRNYCLGFGCFIFSFQICKNL